MQGELGKPADTWPGWRETWSEDGGERWGKQANSQGRTHGPRPGAWLTLPGDHPSSSTG